MATVLIPTNLVFKSKTTDIDFAKRAKVQTNIASINIIKNTNENGYTNNTLYKITENGNNTNQGNAPHTTKINESL